MCKREYQLRLCYTDKCLSICAFIYLPVDLPTFCLSVFLSIHTYVHTYMHTCMHIRICIFSYSDPHQRCICMHACMHAGRHAPTQTLLKPKVISSWSEANFSLLGSALSALAVAFRALLLGCFFCEGFGHVCPVMARLSR